VAEATQLQDIVLVVEDSTDNLGMLTEALETAGMTVLVAVSGDAALALVENITPDNILMDAMMPGKDGFETTRLLKRRRVLSHVPVIFMTGLSETEHIVKGLEAGGVDYVTKPVVLGELIARIRVHLANARATQGARVALDATGRHLLLVDSGGAVLWSTPQASRLLTDVATNSSDETFLPLAVRNWLAGAIASDRSATRFNAEIGGTQLEFSYLARTGGNQYALRITEKDDTTPERRLRDQLGLTSREAEVLLWTGRGKSNKDIAEILALSPRTVNKHLEQIFAKLGVENRTAAAALAAKVLTSTL
jgi:DNA-binding response OmpR family regulator/DNA-binding CsgD family transcriptional regulator